MVDWGKREMRVLVFLVGMGLYSTASYGTLAHALLDRWPTLNVWNWPVALVESVVAALAWPACWAL